jgi:succinyl-diaminopimelate desuccinylase
LLQNIDDFEGDAVINADVGSLRVVRTSEEDAYWFQITAKGVAAHSTPVCKGINAVDRLRITLEVAQLVEKLPFEPPREVVEAINAAHEVSEELACGGEGATLQTITFKLSHRTSFQVRPVHSVMSAHLLVFLLPR